VSPQLIASDVRTFTASRPLWENALFLAENYGWNPAGTKPPDMPEDVIPARSTRSSRLWKTLIDRWDPDKGYTSCVGALVTGPDGRAMAEALAAALEDVPDRTRPAGKMGSPRSGPAVCHPNLRFAFARLTERLGEKEKLRALIAFLLVGDPFRLS